MKYLVVSVLMLFSIGSGEYESPDNFDILIGYELKSDAYFKSKSIEKKGLSVELGIQSPHYIDYMLKDWGNEDDLYNYYKTNCSQGRIIVKMQSKSALSLQQPFLLCLLGVAASGSTEFKIYKLKSDEARKIAGDMVNNKHTVYYIFNLNNRSHPLKSKMKLVLDIKDTTLFPDKEDFVFAIQPK